MNKSLIICALVIGFSLLSHNAKAQDLKAGLGVGYGTQIESVAIQGGIVAGFTNQFRGAADFKYFFPDSPSGADNAFWEINANFHYLLVSEASANVYGLAGINFAHQNIESGNVTIVDNTEVGLNLGAGAEFGLGFADLFGEAKYAISNYDQFDISAGLRFGL